MIQTDNLHLKKPSADDFYNVDDFNDNFDTIDAAIAEKASSTHTHKTSEITDFPESLPANGGNADTVGNKGLAELMNYGFNYTDRLRIETGDLNNYTSGGRFMVITTAAAGAITHSPWTNTGYFLDVYRRADSYVIQIAMNWIGEILIRYIAGNNWSEWVNLKDGGNADTLDGLHASSFYPAKGDNTVGIDYDTLINTGLFEVNGTSTNPTTNSPNGNDSDNNFYVIVYRHSSSQCTQIAISAREDRSVYVRARRNSAWGVWTSFFINYKPHITSVATTGSTIHLKWLPVDGATKYAVSKYNSGTNYTTFSKDITDTEFTITGLTVGTEYSILVQAYINDSWTKFTTADHIIVRTNAFSSGTTAANTTNCPSGAWYGQYEEV